MVEVQWMYTISKNTLQSVSTHNYWVHMKPFKKNSWVSDKSQVIQRCGTGGNYRHHPKQILDFCEWEKERPREVTVLFQVTHVIRDWAGPDFRSPIVSGQWAGGHWGQDSLVMWILEDAGLALYVQTSQDNGMISGIPCRGDWSGLAANGRRALWSTLMLSDVYSPFTWC